MIPISKSMLEPIIKSNVPFVNSLEEFEQIKLEPNTNFTAFDNFKQCFYMKECDKHGEYSRVKIYFYMDFYQKARSIEKEEFICKCKKLGYSADKVEIACLLFLDCWSHQDVCDWLWETKREKIEYDSMRTKKSRMRKELYPELVKYKSKQKINNIESK